MRSNNTQKHSHKKKRIKLIILVLLLAIFAVVAIGVKSLFLKDLSDHEKGWVIYNGKICYCDGNGDVKTGLNKINGKYYYFKKTGKNRGEVYRKGYILIDGNPYYFTKNGKAAKKGWIEEDGEKKYYCTGNGKLKIGWGTTNDVAYYLYSKEDKTDAKVGELARDYQFSKCLYIPESGYIDGEEGKALSYGIKVLDENGWTLKSAYRYAASFVYGGRYERYDYKIHKCAIQGFEHRTGNCLVWMGSFCTLARLMGYDCQLVWGFMIHKGKEIPHSWTEIVEDGEVYVYDPRHANGKNDSGFRVQYGQKGTYNYVESKKTYLEW